MSVGLIPRHFATVMSALLVLATVALMLSLHVGEKSAIGQVRQIVALGNGHSFLRVALPFATTTRPIVAADDLIKTRNIVEGDWVLAYGKLSPIGGRPLFVADAIAGIHASPLLLASAADWEGKLREIPFVAILIGCATLVFGRLITTVMPGLLLAAIGSLLVWHGGNAAAFGSWITLPPHSIYPIVVTGAVAGLVLGWRSSEELGSVWQRLMALTLCYALLPQITARFGWPDAVSWALLIATIALPVIAYSLIGAFFLVVGFDPRGEAAFIILMISAVTAFAVQAWTALPPASAVASKARERWENAESI